MAALYFLACLNGQCELQKLHFQGSIAQCELYAQMPITEWLQAQHKPYEIQSYACKAWEEDA